MRLRSAAVAYAKRGWPVFPVLPGQKIPATKHGCKDATDDPEQVAALWTREYNIGLATGEASGLWVVDVAGTEGLDNLAALGHGIPGTLTAHTPSGGLHLLFLDPGGLGNTASKIAGNVDTRGTGGYIVVAPSVHPNGGRYRWAGKQAPEPVPGWLIRLVREAPAERARREIKVSGDATGYVRTAMEGESRAVAQATEGTRNDTLNRAGWNLGTLVGASLLDRVLAREVLEQAAAQCGLGPREIANTLDRALDDGAANPRKGAAA